jgi:cytochrome c peroxidase
MHDGSLPTLEAVISYYNGGGVSHEGLDPRIRPLGLSAAQQADLAAFLDSLTGSDIETLVSDARSEAIGDAQ